MDIMQVKFNRFFEAILKDLRRCLQMRQRPAGYAQEFGDEVIRHCRPLPGEPKGDDHD